MSLKQLINIAKDKDKFKSINDYIVFCQRYLDFIQKGLQAIIVSQNETNYCFFQYRKEGNYNITRPINSDLMYQTASSGVINKKFIGLLRNARDIPNDDQNSRTIIRNTIYTIQQSIGATLDALPAGQSNIARKVNGDLFERLIKLLILEIGIDCQSQVINIPVNVDGIEQFKMSYQHDLLLFQEKNLKVIGSIKTSSKDRLDKIFTDKFLYGRLTETDTPHIAIFLNDVQRKNTKTKNRYGINSTFLPGHFKGYTVKLTPLDGVYYCDIRPNMKTDALLRQYIKTIDYFFCNDVYEFMNY
jgi:hypothetical protein